MSTTYRTVQGDTFARIAGKLYGDELQASAVQRANPGVFEPITAGTTVYVPDLPDAPLDRVHQVIADGTDEVAVTISGKRFRFWTEIRLTEGVDSVSSIGLSAPFESDIKDYREFFRPFSFQPLTVTVGGKLVFTGTVVGVLPTSEPSTYRVIRLAAVAPASD